MRSFIALNGIAILAVVANHAASWGYTAMFWWTDSYRPVAVPNYDQMGSMPYYLLLFFKQITVFSVPAFLFVTGFFLAYTNRGSQEMLDGRVIGKRITALLIPYLVWSLVIFLGDFLQGITYPLSVYGKKLLLGGASPPYYYIPLIIQFWLISPWIVRYAKKRWNSLLIITGLIALVIVFYNYTRLVVGGSPFPGWLFPGLVFFFSLGSVTGFRLQQVVGYLSGYRRPILVFLVLFAILATVEPEVIFQVTGQNWKGGILTLSTYMYAIFFLLWFLSSKLFALKNPYWIIFLGRNSYGIYLMHPMLLEFFARFTHRLLPGMLAFQFLFLPLLIVFAVGVSLLIMRLFTQPPLRKSYRYLFG